jgi:hypothetical protein
MKQESPTPIKKRKKSVHFPENHVIPIDDSSYDNSSDASEEKHHFGYEGPAHVADNSSDSSDTYIIQKEVAKKTSKTPQKFLLSSKSKRKGSGDL